LDSGWENASKADLCLVLGSSLTVSPACKMPELVGKNGKLVICNLQKTPYDSIAAAKIYAKTDDVMRAVMQRLNIEIPPFILNRRVKIIREPSKITIQAVDFDGTPATIFSEVCFGSTEIDKEPFVMDTPPNSNPLAVTLHFYGHYNEPPITLNLDFGIGERYVDLHYNPLTGVWNVEDKGSTVEFIQVPKRELTDIQRIPQTIRQSKPPVPLQTGFSVSPKTDCPHFSSHVVMGIVQKVAPAFQNNACKTCKDKSENWICLTCGDTFCSRFVQGHAMVHYKETGHAITLSFSDLSLWCYLCEEYITHENLQGIVQTLSWAKFG